LDALHEPETGQDDGGSEGDEEVRRKHADTIGPPLAQGVSPCADGYTLLFGEELA
jgi:hypothetical protein